VTPDLTYIVQIERVRAKIGGREDVTSHALRATMISRHEDGAWKLVHRHADPITTAQPAESVLKPSRNCLPKQRTARCSLH